MRHLLYFQHTTRDGAAAMGNVILNPESFITPENLAELIRQEVLSLHPHDTVNVSITGCTFVNYLDLNLVYPDAPWVKLKPIAKLLTKALRVLCTHPNTRATVSINAVKSSWRKSDPQQVINESVK
jgi:hypothetical protein